MKSIVLTYPGYQTLPRSLKQLLVASETHFFSEATTRSIKPRPQTSAFPAPATLKPKQDFLSQQN